MKCIKCGYDLSSDSKFCTKCGSPTGTEVKVEKATQPKKAISFLKGAGSLLAFIIAFAVVRYLSSEGFASLSKNKQKNDAIEKTTSYFTDTGYWKEFNSTLGNFKASFPVYPTHETIPIEFPEITDALKVEQYSADQSDGTFYMVNYVLYPQSVDTSSPINNLEGSVNGEVQSVNGELISSSLTTHAGYDAIDYVIYIPKNDAYFKGRNILIDKSLYQIVTVYESKNVAAIQYEKFINSFSLNK